MLPGVECARRRRFHQSGGSSDCLTAPAYGGTRRPSFCLYTSNNEKTHHITSTSLMVLIYTHTSIYLCIYVVRTQLYGVKTPRERERVVGCRRRLWDERAECSDGRGWLAERKSKSAADSVTVRETESSSVNRMWAFAGGGGQMRLEMGWVEGERGERSRTWRSPNDSLSFSGDSPSWGCIAVHISSLSHSLSPSSAPSIFHLTAKNALPLRV